MTPRAPERTHSSREQFSAARMAAWPPLLEKRGFAIHVGQERCGSKFRIPRSGFRVSAAFRLPRSAFLRRSPLT